MTESCLALAVQDTENSVRTNMGWPNILWMHGEDDSYYDSLQIRGY
jgi:hypothetical protein